MPLIQMLSPGPKASDPAHLATLPHVLFVVDGFPKALGGGERIVLRLAAMLPAYGFRASILTFKIHPESSFRPENAPCPLYLLPLTNTYGLAAWRGAFAFGRFLREHQVRLVQTFFESSDLWAGAMTRLLSPAKLVWSRRDMGILRGSKHKAAYRLFRHLPHAVMAVSERVARHVIDVDGVSPSRVIVVHNGLDLSRKTTRKSRSISQPPVVTTVGNVRHVKGHDLLIDAAQQVIQTAPDVQFTIAGEILEPMYFAELQARIAAESLSHHFHFLGKITDLSGHLAQADVFVLPSRSEGFSNALIEAMATGLPCIATDVGGNAEAIQHGKSGLIIPPENASALADAILQVLLNPDRASEISSCAQQAVQSDFTADAMLRKIVSTYQRILFQ